MKKVIIVIGLSTAFFICPSVQAETTTTNGETNQQEIAAYKIALNDYRNATKIYRVAQSKARAEIKVAREIYKATRRQATSPAMRLEALKTFRTAKAAALAQVPKKPVRPKKPTP